MPCITVIVPGVGSGSSIVGEIENGVQRSLAGWRGLPSKDFWVYVLTTQSHAPATKVTVETLDLPDRIPGVMQDMAKIIGKTVSGICSSRGLSSAVVVYTHRQSARDGFFEIVVG